MVWRDAWSRIHIIRRRHGHWAWPVPSLRAVMPPPEGRHRHGRHVTAEVTPNTRWFRILFTPPPHFSLTSRMRTNTTEIPRHTRHVIRRISHRHFRSMRVVASAIAAGHADTLIRQPASRAPPHANDTYMNITPSSTSTRSSHNNDYCLMSTFISLNTATTIIEGGGWWRRRVCLQATTPSMSSLLPRCHIRYHDARYVRICRHRCHRRHTMLTPSFAITPRQPRH